MSFDEICLILKARNNAPSALKSLGQLLQLPQCNRVFTGSQYKLNNWGILSNAYQFFCLIEET